MNTIYLADDNPADRAILEGTLNRLGYGTRAFDSGATVQRALHELSEPAIVLLDWMMPERNGIDICYELSILPPPYPLYIIMVTGRSQKSDLAYALEHGADDFVAKPFDICELSARINVGIRLLTMRQQLLETNERLNLHSRHVEALAEERAEQLIRADRLSTIGLLSAGMAHEINNPASFVSINIQTLGESIPLLRKALDGSANENEKCCADAFLATFPELINEMKTGIGRIHRIVNGLRTYVHADAAKQQTLNLDYCIESALHLCANRLKYNVSVQKELTDIPNILGDPYQIEQVLINLFTNAADAIDETGKEGVLHICIRHNGNTVYLTVHDSGPGIPPASLEHIFMPFFTTKDVGKGTGLGLAISRNIMKDHNGDLFVENHPSGGALFTLTFPVTKDIPQ